MQTLVFVLLIANAVCAHAGELSLIDKAPEINKEQVLQGPVQLAREERPMEGDFEQMKEFMRQENEKVKAIKILNLDLARADLELKKKEIEVKLADLNKGHAIDENHSKGSSDLSTPSRNVTGIFVNGPVRSAWMDVHGKHAHVQEGEFLSDGVLVKTIKGNQVTLEYADGKQDIMHFGP